MRRVAIAIGLVACGGVVLAYGLTFEAVELAVFAGLLVAAACIDIETRRIPNWIIASACAVRLAYILVAGAMGFHDLRALAFDSFAGAAGLGLGLLVFTVVADRLTQGQNMGGGDIKLLATVGLYLGLAAGCATLALACILGATSSIVLQRRTSRGVGGDVHAFAFGPSIAIASIAVIIVASPLFGNLV